MDLFVTFAFWVAYFYLFFGLYILIMGVYRAHLAGKLTPLLYVLTGLWLLLGLLIDVIANVVITVLFLDAPQEWLVTQRLTRYVKSGIGWRFGLACWVCDRLLDPFDPAGDHC